MTFAHASSLIFGNRLNALKQALVNQSGPFNYIVLAESIASRESADFLQSLPEAQELPASSLIRQRNVNFGERYVEFLGWLNRKNQSLDWWSMTFTDRNPSAPGLCRDVLHFDLVSELALADDRPLVVIIDSPRLGRQLITWAHGKNIPAYGSVYRPWSIIRFLKEHTASGHLLAMLRTLSYWRSSRRFKPRKESMVGHTVITSLVHPWSFTDDGRYWDAYFGPLVDRYEESGGKVLVFGLMMENPANLFKKLKSVDSKLPIIPLESCLSLASIIKCVFRSLWNYLKPTTLRGSTKFNGNDIAPLLNDAAREDRRSGNLFMNLRMYYAAKTLSRIVRPNRWLYLYENLVWEKMMLLGGRSISPKPYMVGYQHSSITLSHLDLMLAKDEAEFMPLPDQVLTSGNVTKAWFEEKGNYPVGMIKSACALRQPMSFDTKIQERSIPLSNILVALATSVQEYLNSLAFLESAVRDLDGCDLRVRPHPVIPLQGALRGSPLEGKQFYIEDKGTLEDALDWADVVLYTSSTVGLEAVSKGIPAIYLDLGIFLDTDPMFAWNELKWSVQEPAELAATIASIGAIPADEFVSRQKRGQEYAVSYLRPLTEETLRPFWGDLEP